MSPRKQRKDNTRDVGADFLEFQPDSLAIELRPMPFLARSALYVALLLVVAALTWACLAKVDKVVMANGKLVSDARPLVVQPLETGIITEIHVSLGQTVEQGAPLITLDSTSLHADLDHLLEQRWSLRLEILRLQAELNGDPLLLPANAPQADRDIQRSLANRRQEEYASILESYESRIKETEARIKTLMASRESMKSQLEMAWELEEIHTSLYDDGFASKVEMLSAKSQRLNLVAEYERKGNEITELKEALEKAVADRKAFASQWRREALTSLHEAKTALEDIEARLRKTQWRGDQVVLRAPGDGVVLKLAERSVGSVVNTAEALVTLAPLGEPLLALVDLPTKDISYVRENDKVRIKLETLPYQKHGMLEGRVVTISEDALAKETAGGEMPLYQARISLEKTELLNVDPDFRLRPGMLVTAEIMVGERRVVAYFLYPMIRAFNETLREP